SQLAAFMPFLILFEDGDSIPRNCPLSPPFVLKRCNEIGAATNYFLMAVLRPALHNRPAVVENHGDQSRCPSSAVSIQESHNVRVGAQQPVLSARGRAHA